MSNFIVQLGGGEGAELFHADGRTNCQNGRCPVCQSQSLIYVHYIILLFTCILLCALPIILGAVRM